MVNCLIRSYADEDLEMCRLLWEELTAWHRQIYDDNQIGGDDPGRQFDEHLARVGAENIWLAVVDDVIAGMVGVIPPAAGDTEGELEPLVVFERFRGEGIGAALARTVINHARENNITHFKVRPVGRNAEAIQFFHQMGFCILGHIEMFMDLKQRDRDIWIDGVVLGGRKFKI